MACILLNLPNWIQALAAVSIVGLTVATLIVLRDYAADTKTIACASVSQLENSQMPFLAVGQEGYLPGQVGGWVLENQGSGSAINVSYRYNQGGEIVRDVPPLAPGTKRSLQNDFANAIGNPLGFEIRYESLSGARYRTMITWGGRGEMQTRFERPAAI